MLSILYHKLKHLVLTFRVSILTIFISLFLISMLSLISLTYYRSLQGLTQVAFNAMKAASTSAYEKFTNEIDDGILETEFSARLVQSRVVDPDKLPEVSNHVFNLMWVEAKTLPSVQSAFWGDDQGDFVIASENADKTITTEIVDRTNTVLKDILNTRDTSGNIINTKSENHFFFDPRVYSWFQMAKLSKTTFITDVYSNPLANPPILTVTIATPVFTTQGNFLGVFGLNIHLAYLRKFIETISVSPHGIIYVVRDDGKVVAYPNIVQFRNPGLMDIRSVPQSFVIDSFQQFKKHQQTFFQFTYQHQKYWASYTPIHYFKQPTWWIGVVVPEEDFVGELHKTNILTLLISFAILFLGIYFVSKLVTRVVRPLKNLVKETEKIKNFQLAEEIRIPSRIKEVIQLSFAMNAMKKGLRTFQKYVPANLVRQLVEAGDEANVGGAKKELVILFSDIDKFTQIAEQMDPKELMTHLCDYFNVVSRIIVDHHGTIDKYIGDAVMAFWGAPLAVSNPCELAARAALQCKNTLMQFNRTGQQSAKPAFSTRIGIHMGDAIVGNLGSSERLNYTAVGDVINMANRLESVNKIYGTKIIVSEKIYLILKNVFVFRKVDLVKLKGKEQAGFIYELLAENKMEIGFDIERYSEIFEKGFIAYQHKNWDEAIRYFSECLQLYTDDQVAKIFIQRCESFKRQPPGANWQGVWEM